MNIYSVRSSSPVPPTKNVASRGLLVAIIILIIIVPIALVAAFYYVMQPPNIGQNVPAPTTTPSPYSPSVSPSPSEPAATPSTGEIPKYTLAEAESAGYVEATVTGVSGSDIGTTGASSGDVIILHIQRLVNYTIEITPFPTGTLLVPDSSAVQPMAILQLQGISEGLYYEPHSQIILDTNEQVDYLFSAYCVDFKKDNPTDLTIFTANGMADADVVKILNAVDQLPESTTTIEGIQVAIFAVTNNVSYDELSTRFTSDQSEISNAKTILEKAGIDTTNLRLFQ
jgi:hypothetical protein